MIKTKAKVKQVLKKKPKLLKQLLEESIWSIACILCMYLYIGTKIQSINFSYDIFFNLKKCVRDWLTYWDLAISSTVEEMLRSETFTEENTELALLNGKKTVWIVYQ